MKSLAGIMVGSRTMLQDLVRFVDANGITPVIDREFAFGEAAAAFRHLRDGAFGKVGIRTSG